MAKILSDREIARLVGTAIKDADPNLIDPNGIQLRLGKHVRFLATDEEKELGSGLYMRVNPGETVLISSFEQIDFSRDTVNKLFPGCMLMALITPTTTMMREGILQVATKIDAGFRGTLNWGLRNSSINELTLQYQTPIFKLTIFLLDKDESPEVAYGQNADDHYQDSKGIVPSARRLPASIPKGKVVSSSFDKLDPKKQLSEAGYPFNHIGTELMQLHGKFEVVSTDMRVLKDQFDSQTKELSGKIETETNSLASKLKETEKTLLDKFSDLFNQRFLRIAGIIIGAIPIMYGGVVFLQKRTRLGSDAIAFITMLAGAVIILLSWALTRNQK